MKKIALFLILIVCVVMLSACGNGDREYKASINSDDVALLSIFTYDGKGESVWGLMNLGHSFLSIKNVSDEPFYLSEKKINPGETVAFGTWSILDHFGVWYNVESNYISDYNKYDGRLSVTQSVSSEDISVITEYIKKHDYWTPLTNCSCFALNLWNSVSDAPELLDVPLIYTPSQIAKQLQKFNTFETNRTIVTEKTFGYFKDGSYINCYLEGGDYEAV